MTFKVKKAVFPVAGLGTRFLPATKTVPKEMLPVVDKPLIQYAVDALKVDSAEESLAMIRTVLADQAGPARDIVCLNAGAAIYVSGCATTLAAGVDAARAAISSGKAAAILENLVARTNAND